MINMPRIKEVEKDLREVIEEVLEIDMTAREAKAIIKIASKDKNVYEAVIRVKDNPDDREASDNYNNVVNREIYDLHDKFFELFYNHYNTTE